MLDMLKRYNIVLYFVSQESNKYGSHIEF